MDIHAPRLELHFPQRQAGAVLVFSILVLLILTVLGVASMSSSNMQERMAGNARLEAEAFAAASAGVSNSLNYAITQFDDAAVLPDLNCGGLEHEGWMEVVDGEKVPWASEWASHPPVAVGNAQYQLRMYCLVDQSPPDPDDAFCVANPDACGQPRSQLFVESRGQRLVGGQPVAERSIEVRVGLVGDFAAGDGCSAMCLPGGVPANFQFPNSNRFKVDGDGGPAITTGTDELRDAIRNGIRDNRIGNYEGGIATTEIGKPWNDPASVEAFRTWAEFGASFNGNAYYDSTFRQSGNPEYGTELNPQITYFDGNVDFGGTVSGHGIMVVNGTFEGGGTPQFNGLLVVLGGEFVINGGGTGGGPEGSVVILNSDGSGNSNLDFGTVGAAFAGGGSALYAFDCENLIDARDDVFRAIDDGLAVNPDGTLSDPGQVARDLGGDKLSDLIALLGNPDAALEDLWNPECDAAPPNLYLADGTHYRILSWRENIGWREASEFAGAAIDGN